MTTAEQLTPSVERWHATLTDLLPERDTVIETSRVLGHYGWTGAKGFGRGTWWTIKAPFIGLGYWGSIARYAPEGINRVATPTVGFLLAVNLGVAAAEKRKTAELESARADDISDKKSKRKALRLAEQAARRANVAETWARVNLHLRIWPASVATIGGGGYGVWEYAHAPGYAQIGMPVAGLLLGGLGFGALARPEDAEPIITPRRTGDFDVTAIREAMAKLGIKKLADDIEDVNIPMGGRDPKRECYRFEIETPPTVSARAVIKDRNAWATALGIQEFRIRLEEAPTLSARTFILTVFDNDPGGRVQDPYPYDGSATVDATGPVVVGDGLMGEPTTVTNPDGDTGVFGIKGSGKTERIKNLLVPLVLDPRQDVKIIDAKDTNDYLDFEPACSDYLTGSSFEQIRAEVEMLEWVRDTYMADIAEAMREHGVRKITKENAHLPGLQFLTIVIEECQALFEHPDFGERAEAAVGWVQKMGRAYGIKFIFGTQVPTKKALPTEINGQISTRFCHRMEFQTQVAQAIGTSAYEPGGAAQDIAETDRGTGVVKGGGNGTLQTSRAYLLTPEMLSPIIQKGKDIRGGKVTKRLETLPAEAENPEGTGNILDDIMSLRPETGNPGPGLHYQMVVDQLRAKYPSRYGERFNVEMLKSTLHTHGVIPSRQVSIPGLAQPNKSGYKWTSVDAARKGVRP